MLLEITEHTDGKLYIRDSWDTDSFEPKQVRRYWPTGLKAEDYPELIGRPAEPWGSAGVYRVRNKMGFEQFIELPDGQDTKNSHCEEKPVKRPKWAREWSYGKWVR